MTNQHSPLKRAWPESSGAFLPRDTMRYMLSSCVWLAIRPSHAGIVPKWLNKGSHKQCHMIVDALSFTVAKVIGEIPSASPPTGAPNRGGVN